jgi:hypothetical protein
LVNNNLGQQQPWSTTTLANNLGQQQPWSTTTLANNLGQQPWPTTLASNKKGSFKFRACHFGNEIKGKKEQCLFMFLAQAVAT